MIIIKNKKNIILLDNVNPFIKRVIENNADMISKLENEEQYYVLNVVEAGKSELPFTPLGYKFANSRLLEGGLVKVHTFEHISNNSIMEFIYTL